MENKLDVYMRIKILLVEEMTFWKKQMSRTDNKFIQEYCQLKMLEAKEKYESMSHSEMQYGEDEEDKSIDI